VNNRNEFVAENDSLLITYRFHGLNGPVQVSIFNKSDHGIRIDWKRSSLIVDDKPYTYYKPVMEISGVVENNRRRDNDVKGTITIDQETEFIPPASGITRTEFKLIDAGTITVRNAKLQTLRKKHGIKTIKKGEFNRLTSPFAFRSYLTFVTGTGETREFAVDHSFYVSQLISSSQQPTLEWLNSEDKGNEFYLRNVTGAR
jgi:hypothetical protein